MTRSPLRARLAGAAMLVVALAGVAGGVLGLAVLRTTLVDEVDRAVLARAEVLADANAGEEFVVLGRVVTVDEIVAVVLGDDDVVLAADPEDLDVTALLDASTDGDGFLVVDEPFTAAVAARDGASHRIAVTDLVDDNDDELLVLVGSSLEPAERTLRQVRTGLLVAVPTLTLLVGGLVWWLTGRSLRSVEQLRRQVDDVSAERVDGRVTPPGSAAELDRLAATLNELLTRIQAARDLQSRFVADASHELRTPIAALAVQLEVAARPGAGRPDLGALTRQVERLGELVDGLLVLARLDTGSAAQRRDLVDLDERVRAGVGLVPPRDGVTVEQRALTAAQVRGDGSALERVVVNLVANAVRHAASRVRVTLVEEAGAAVLGVADDGPGIAPADRGRVLERFVRLDDARARDGGGSGLGLAICDEIVRAHGGQLTVGDRVRRAGPRVGQPARGTLVEVRLPTS